MLNSCSELSPGVAARGAGLAGGGDLVQACSLWGVGGLAPLSASVVLTSRRVSGSAHILWETVTLSSSQMNSIAPLTVVV